MCANIHWGNIHNQALDIAGNVATELELLDPVADDVSRCLLATLCDGIEGMDRAVIINSLEILYKLCQKEQNEDHINKCLDDKFYQTLCLFLSLNDIMLLIFTLEAIYALTSMGARSCSHIMQVRGIVDQLVSLITVEAQSYGPDGCILMRVVETVPGNMLPIVAQNIANLQNVNVMPKQPIPVNPAHMQILQNPNVMPPVQPHATQMHSHAAHEQQDKPVASVQQPQTAQAQPQSFTHEDEQYAMAWLGATFERSPSNDSRIEQQELYRMYLSHCQKSGKHSVVNHLKFPGHVRLIFGHSVGPVIVKRADGTEMPGFHYVSLRLRAQPLPIQSKAVLLQNAQKASAEAARKLNKKKLKQDAQQVAMDTSSLNIKSEVIAAGSGNVSAVEDSLIAAKQESVSSSVTAMDTSSSAAEASGAIKTEESTPSALNNAQQQSQPTSSVIKSMLANKVSQRQQSKQKELVQPIIAPAATATTAAAIVHTPVAVTAAATSATVSTAVPPAAAQQPLKVPSNAISALVNNPIMQSTPLKVGQTTIKPFTPHSAQIEKKPIIDNSAPPPLAPLSGSNVAKDASGRPVIIANQMLVDMLDKKNMEPQIPASIIKRKIEESPQQITDAKRLALDSSISNEPAVTPSKNAANLYADLAASLLEDEDLEELEQQTAPPPPPPSLIMPSNVSKSLPSIGSGTTIVHTTGAGVSNVQRQLVFQTNQPPQLKMNAPVIGSSNTQQIPTAMATIKTDQGLQTVPVILQQTKPDMQSGQPQIIQQVIQQPQPQQTQYVLATNPQGQTYLVAQQPQPPPPPPPQTQTVLVTQTPQQQSAGTKTIIILQQQPQQPSQQLISTPGGQKMIMTTPQGQQVLVTQRSAANVPPPQQYYIQTQGSQAGTIMQRQIIQAAPSNMMQTSSNVSQQALQTGQISPSLLSQLNHIPATIKLHQPQPVQPTMPPQPTIIRPAKPVSIVQTSSSGQILSAPIQIPQLQQHQSIIQQHIVSGPTSTQQHIVSGATTTPSTVAVVSGSMEKPAQRQVILGTGSRPIEIKETIITQAPTVVHHQQPQQPQQATLQPTQATIIGGQQQQVTQQQHLQQTTSHIAAQQHSSLIQQKITMPTSQSSSSSSLVIQPAKTVTTTAMSMPTPPQAAQSITPPAASTIIKKLPVSTVPLIAPKPAPIAKPVAAPPLVAAMEAAKSEEAATSVANTAAVAVSTPTPATTPVITSTVVTPAPAPALPADATWLYICDWRNCPRKKFKSLGDLQHHACAAHAPDHLDAGAEIFCQWGAGPGLCDGIPRKRYSLMTHIMDRHMTVDSLRAAVQRRIATGAHQTQPTQPTVTIVRNVEQSQQQRNNTASPALSSSSSSSSLPATGSSAMQAIKRHTADYLNSKELMDENEGPVTKSIRLTASLILRNLVTYTTTAKRNLKRYEPHLATIALSNVESSVAISHILHELNEK